LASWPAAPKEVLAFFGTLSFLQRLRRRSLLHVLLSSSQGRRIERARSASSSARPRSALAFSLSVNLVAVLA
jgi:hypothetical protein